MRRDRGLNVAERSSRILACLSNHTRRRIIQELATGPRTYTELAEGLEIDPDSETGLLNYHLRKMRSAGVVARGKEGYSLTELGSASSRLLSSLESQICMESKGRGDGLEVIVEPYLDGSLGKEKVEEAGKNGAPVDERFFFGKRAEGIHKHIFLDLGVCATQIAKVGDRLAGMLPAYTATLHRQELHEVGTGRFGLREPDADHPANWIGASFFAPWVDPDFAEREEEISRALVESFVAYCRGIGAETVVAERVPIGDESLLVALHGSGFEEQTQTTDMILRLKE